MQYRAGYLAVSNPIKYIITWGDHSSEPIVLKPHSAVTWNRMAINLCDENGGLLDKEPTTITNEELQFIKDRYYDLAGQLGNILTTCRTNQLTPSLYNWLHNIHEEPQGN